MAEFNPDVPDTGMPNYMRMSEGGQVDRSKGIAFSGLGNLISGAVKTGDTYVQNDIKDKVNYSVQSVNTELGLDPDPRTQVPYEITSSTNQMSKLAQAQAQGQVTPEYYYQRLAMTMRGLRSRYPGYEDYVDSAIQKVTGMNPANSYRDALLSNINAANNAAAAASADNSKYIRDNEYRLTPQEQATLTPDQKFIRIQQARSTEYQRDSENKQLEYDQKHAEPILGARWNQYVGDTIATIGTSIGGSGADLGTILGQPGGPKFSNDQISAMTGQIDAAKLKLSQQMDQDAAKYGSSLGVTKTTEMKTAALKQLDDLKTMINQGQYSDAARLTASLSNQRDLSLKQLYDDPVVGNTIKSVQAIAAANPALAQSLMDKFLSDPSNVARLNYLQRSLAGNLAAGVSNGDIGAGDMANSIANNGGQNQTEKANLLQTVLNGATMFAAQAERTPEQIGKFVGGMYGQKADALWSTIPGSQRMVLYNKLFSPEITAKIKASGNADAWRAYEADAVDRFKTIPALTQASADLNENLPYDQFIQVQYDPTNHRLVASYAPGAANQGFFGGTQTGNQMRGIKNTIQTLNEGLANLGPIMDAAGGDPSQNMKVLLGELNASLGQGKQTSIYRWLENSLNAGADAAIGSSGRGPRGETPSEGQGTQPVIGPANGSPQISTPQEEDVNNEFNTQELAKSLPDEKALQTFRDTDNTRDASMSTGEGGLGGLLTLIGRAEGTDRGRGYNETLANGKLTGGPVDLTGMTLNEIDNLQTRMLRNPNNRWNSSAVGRYQIIRTTLRGLRDRLGLSGNELFDEKMQDKLATALINEAGYKEWSNGQMSDRNFSRGIARQWASIADMSGKTYYKGQSRVGATANEVLGSLSGNSVAPEPQAGFRSGQQDQGIFQQPAAPSGETGQWGQPASPASGGVDSTGQPIEPGYHEENGTILADRIPGEYDPPAQGWNIANAKMALGDGWDKSQPVPLQGLTPEVAQQLANEGYKVPAKALATDENGHIARAASADVGNDRSGQFDQMAQVPAIAKDLRASGNVTDLRQGNVPPEQQREAFNEGAAAINAAKNDPTKLDLHNDGRNLLVFTPNYVFTVQGNNVWDLNSWRVVSTRQKYREDQATQVAGMSSQAQRAAQPADNPLASSVETFAADQKNKADQDMKRRIKEFQDQFPPSKSPKDRRRSRPKANDGEGPF